MPAQGDVQNNVKFDRKMNMCMRGNRVARYHGSCKMIVVTDKSGRHKERRLEWEGWAMNLSAGGVIVFGGAGILVGCPWM